MATHEATVENDALKKVVKCPSCSIYLNSTSLVFPQCKHTLCQDCFSALPRNNRNNERTDISSVISCPICDLPASEACMQEINGKLLEGLLSIADDSPKEEHEVLIKDNRICTGCESRSSVCHCKNCDTVLCDFCLELHTKDNHDVVRFPDTRAAVKEIKMYCKEHPNQLLEMNCAECNEIICAQCKFQKHDTHRSESIEKAIEKYVRKAKPILSEGSVRLDHQGVQLETIEKKCSALEKNKLLTRAQLQAHKDNMIKEIVGLINKEFNKLSSELENGAELQIKDLEATKKGIEKDSRSVSSLHNWVKVIIRHSSGPSLLKEFQSGVLDTLEALKYTEPKHDVKTTIKINQFHPAKPDFPTNINLGDVRVLTQSFFDSPVTHHKKQVSDIRYRKVQINLCLLSSMLGRVEKSVKVDTASFRLCLFEQKLWIPSPSTNSINVFPIEKEGESVETILDLGDVAQPRSLHPINADIMVLAADSGLYTIDGKGHVKGKLHKGKFCDVYIGKSQMVALESRERKVLIWSISQLANVETSFEVLISDEDAANTVCMLKDYIYICDCDKNIVLKYNFKGTLVQEFGISGKTEGGELNRPYLCAVDQQGDLLLADCENHRFQVLTNTGKWSVMKMKVYKPRDVVIMRSSMYILHNEGSKISKYPL